MNKDEQEIKVQASVGGRRLTLDPVMDQVQQTFTPSRVESSIPAGFRVTWLSGNEDNMEFELASGAGFGSPYMVLTIRENGETYAEEVVDMRPVMEMWIMSVLAQGPTSNRMKCHNTIQEQEKRS